MLSAGSLMYQPVLILSLWDGEARVPLMNPEVLTPVNNVISPEPVDNVTDTDSPKLRQNQLDKMTGLFRFTRPVTLKVKLGKMTFIVISYV